MKEIWKPVVGYEGKYEVSNFGRVRSLTRIVERSDGSTRLRKGKMLSLVKDVHGYNTTFLFCNGNKKTVKVHRLVAMAFIPNTNNFPIINHKDENKANNHVDNLEWCDQSYNINYGNRNKNCILTANKNNSSCAEKPVLQFTFDGKIVKRYPSLKEVERTIGKSYVPVSSCCSGKSKYSYGYIWIFEKDIDTLEERLKEAGGKRVVQLDLKSYFVKVWESASVASRQLGIRESSIGMCCSGRYKTAGGFKWVKEKDYLKFKNNEQF